jgi:hypothetical protein
MDEQHKFTIPRRRFLNGLIGGLAGGGLTAVTGSLVTGARAGSETNDEKRRSRYRVTDEVKTYYRVNSYPT